MNNSKKAYQHSEFVSQIMTNAMEQVAEVTQVPYPRRVTLFNHPISQ